MITPLRTTDNNKGSLTLPPNALEDLRPFANQTIKALCQENPNLLVFPPDVSTRADGIGQETIFSIENNRLYTQNIMGFVGANNTRLAISSRFILPNQSDYFLYHMLQRVLSVNIFNFEQNSSYEYTWDFLLYLFPYYLKKAYQQGLFKAYKQLEHNKANLKGRLLVSDHIRKNIPFQGRIAYSNKENTLDNRVNQLIRHTLEYIENQPEKKSILKNDSTTRQIAEHIRWATENSYHKNKRQQVIRENRTPIVHPYFTQYKALQQICLMILQHKNTYFDQERNKTQGILFDGAWLWEEYLNTVLPPYFLHPENKTGKHKYFLFKGDIQPIFPDFISKSEPKIIADAKYIPLKQLLFTQNKQQIRNIYYKTLAYMLRFGSPCGVLIFPNPQEHFLKVLEVEQSNNYLKIIGLCIPEKTGNFADFQRMMLQNEEKLRQEIVG